MFSPSFIAGHGIIRAVPTVSVIVPAYQVTSYIVETLDSVFGQTRSDYEVIVVNDGCPDTDNLERVLEPYLQRIRYIRQERNAGVAAARNVGISAAQSPYIAFLDADDIWEPDYLETNLGRILADPALDVVYGNARIFGPTLESGLLIMDVLPSVGEVNFSSLIQLRCNVCASSVVRRDMLLHVGMFDIRQKRCEDFDLWLRIAKAGGKFWYHDQVVMNYRKRDASQSSDSRVALQAMIEYCEKVKREFDLTPEEFELAERQRQQFAADLEIHEGKRAFDEGRNRDARSHFSNAQRHVKSRKLSLIMISILVAPGLMRWLHRWKTRRALARVAASEQNLAR